MFDSDIFSHNIEKNAPTKLVRENHKTPLEATISIPASIFESPNTGSTQNATTSATTRDHSQMNGRLSIISQYLLAIRSSRCVLGRK